MVTYATQKNVILNFAFNEQRKRLVVDTVKQEDMVFCYEKIELGIIALYFKRLNESIFISSLDIRVSDLLCNWS